MMWSLKDILIKTLLILSIATFAYAEEPIELKGGQMFSPEMLESIKDLVDGVPIADQELREIRDAANVWKRDSANSQVELRDAKDLDMQGKDIYFEGTTADAYETKITVTNPTADRTITIPDASITLGSGDILYADTRFKVGNFTRDISLTTDQSITGVGFTPKGLILICGYVNPSGGSFSVGAGDGTTSGNGYSIASVGYNRSAYIITIAVDLGNYAQATLQSLDAAGFTLDWTDKQGSPTGTATITYVAWR